MSRPRLAGIAVALCIAGSGAARADIPCMSDEELFGYLFNVTTLSIVTRAGLCARQFPLLQPQFDDILAEDNDEFERQREGVPGLPAGRSRKGRDGHGRRGA